MNHIGVIESLRKRGLSRDGNPNWEIVLRTDDGALHRFATKPNSSIGYMLGQSWEGMRVRLLLERNRVVLVEPVDGVLNEYKHTRDAHQAAVIAHDRAVAAWYEQCKHLGEDDE